MLPPQERLSQQELQRRYDVVRAEMKEKGPGGPARLGHSLRGGRRLSALPD